MFGNPVVKTPDGLSIDWRWGDPATENDRLAIQIRRNMFVQAPKYYVFMVLDFIFVVIGTSFVSLGAILALAMDFIGTHGALWCFAVVIVCSVLNYWLHPHTQMIAYEAAVQENQKARVALIEGDREKAKRRLDTAISLTQPKVL